MISQSIAKRYAKGLFGVGEKNGKYREYLADLDRILAFLDKEERLKRILVFPVVEVQKRKELLSDVMKILDVPAPLANIFTMLIEKNRMNYIHLIRDQYLDLVDEKEGRVKGTVFSAFPLENDTKKRIEAELSAKLSRDVVLSAREDKSLIGGVKVLIGGTIIDGSIKHQLETLKENILKE